MIGGPQFLPSVLHVGSQNIAFGVDFSGALLLETPGSSTIAYDTITSASASIAPADATLSSMTIVAGAGGASTAVVFTVSGGTVGTVYEITFTVTGTSGQIPVLPAFLNCR